MFARGHRARGNECRWITFFHTPYRFQEDLCFNLWAMPSRPWVHSFRRTLNRLQSLPNLLDLEGNPPYWKPASIWEEWLYRLRDSVNTPRILNAIRRWSLDDYDIYHFEQGIDPFRNGRWARELARRGKHIVCFYHGTDLRNRGVIREVHRVSGLNLTSEIDLLPRLPAMKYLYLPIDTDELHPNPRPPDGRIHIGHAARNRSLKGSDVIEAAVRRLAHRYPVDWVMIENMPHDEALRIKATCDIFIDQITDKGGWGYGASSIESLAMEMPTLTLINPHTAAFLGEHPFVSVSSETLERELVGLIEEPERRRKLGKQGREWVIRRHGLDSVMNALYAYYHEAGWA